MASSNMKYGPESELGGSMEHNGLRIPNSNAEMGSSLALSFDSADSALKSFSNASAKSGILLAIIPRNMLAA